MAITIVTSPETILMTELSTLKRELSLDSVDGARDAYLSDLIAQGTDFIRQYTNRNFALTTYRETLQANYPIRPWMILTHTPIVSITGVSFNGSTVSSTTYTVEDADAGLVFREDGWTSSQIYDYYIERQPTNWGRKLWSFTYQAGYVTPCMGSSNGDRTLPYDLERACIDLCKWRYNQSGDFNPGIKRQRTGDASEEYFGTLDDSGGFIPPSIKTLLDSYVRVYVSYNR